MTCSFVSKSWLLMISIKNQKFWCFGSIYTDQLQVHPDHHKNGLGQELMESVHDYGCLIATVATIRFQGPERPGCAA